MLPKLTGTIRRRLLINFRADPVVAQRLIPQPLKVLAHKNAAIVGVCLIRLEHIRPKGFPELIGISSENMAHRIAVTYKDEHGADKEAVYIWKRHSDQPLNIVLGGRLFPGIHSPAKFAVEDDGVATNLTVDTEHHLADVRVAATGIQKDSDFKSESFSTFEEARDFFARGSCGFSCATDDKTLQGMQLITKEWLASPLQISTAESAFFHDTSKWPEGSVEIDCGLIMRNIEHEWQQLHDVPSAAESSLY
jgi:hypothetical protein